MTYVGEKQLGSVLSVGNADNGDVIGTSTEIAQSRAIIFNQTTPGVAVTLTSPVPAGAKLLVIANRGTESITVGTTLIEVGPAYGLFWDGSDFVAQEVEGIGRINSSENTNSITITGDGSPIDPLSLDVVVSTASNNALSITSGGLYVAKMLAGDSSLIVVDGINGSDSNAGTPNAPFATISKALESSGQANYTDILVYPGSYSEDIVLPTNTRLVGLLGSEQDNAVIVEGRITFSAAAGNIAVKNIDFLCSTTSIPVAYFNTTTGNIYFDNSHLIHTGGPSVEAVRFTSASGGHYFNNVEINGIVNIQASSEDEILFNESKLDSVNNASANVSLLIKDSKEIGTVTHSAGNVSLQNIGRITVDGNNDSIISTSNSGMLLVLNTSLLQENRSFGDINKTGTCSYAFSGVARASDNNSFTGTALLVDQATDIHANYTPTAYTATGDNLVGHLEGIDTALAATGGSLSAVTSNDSGTVDFSGSGTAALPLTAEVKVSSAADNAITANVDGLYVPTVDTGLDVVTHSNSDTVDLTGSGTIADPLIAEVSVSTSPNNQLTSNATGLYVPAIQKYIDLIFTTAYHWLADDLLITIPVTRDFTLPQSLVDSIVVMKALANTDISTAVLLHKISGGVSTQVGTITFAYSAASDSGNTLEVDVTITFATATVFSSGDSLTLTSTTEARFDTVTFDLVAARPLGT